MTDAQVAAEVAYLYRADAHPDANWCARALLAVLSVVAEHEALAGGEPIGWIADVRNAIREVSP